MASKKDWVVEMISQLVKDSNPAQAVQTSEIIVERLMEEGLLHLGYGDKDVDRITQKFTDVFGTTKISKSDRFSARRLANKYGGQSVCGIIDLLAKNNGEKYAPVVNSVAQLEEKMPSVLNFLRKVQGKGEEIIDA